MPSTDGLLADRDAADVVMVQRIPKARIVADDDGAPRRGFDSGLNDVLLPIALAGGDVAGQHEVGEGGESDIMRAADAGFKHATAPDRDAGRLCNIVEALGF